MAQLVIASVMVEKYFDLVFFNWDSRFIFENFETVNMLKDAHGTWKQGIKSTVIIISKVLIEL